MICKCQNCGHKCDKSKLKPMPERGILDRVAPGEPMPYGECPKCGAVAHPIDYPIDRLIKNPPAKFESIVDAMTVHDRQSAAESASARLQDIAFLCGYLRERYNGCGGDMGHKKAAKNANRFLTSTRRLLNYSYPASGNISI